MTWFSRNYFVPLHHQITRDSPLKVNHKINLNSMSKITTNEIIAKAKLVHGDKYDYSKVDYVKDYIKVCIICPEHGEFWQRPHAHLQGQGCPKCKSKKQTCTTDEFIAKAKKIHGDKYDYSKVKYVDAKSKVCVVCPEHGEFWQIPYHHTKGCGCPKCANKNKGEYRRSSKKDFITKARKIHGDKYDYSNVDYVNNYTKVCIICPKHGEFLQTPSNHLSGKGCPKCKADKTRERLILSKEGFIKKARLVHGNKYDYSKVEYVNNITKVCIICPEHGEVWQTPNHHLSGCGCHKCGGEKQTSTKEKFIKKAKEIHGDKYDYSKVDYSNAHTKVCIICPNHGEFWQTPNNHLRGHGCPKCKRNQLSCAE